MNIKICAYISMFLYSITFCLSPLRAEETDYSNTSAVLPNRSAGFFSLFFSVVGVANAYDKGELSSVKVDFGKSGYYYSPSKGTNWWNYYFEPIQLGDFNPDNVKIIPIGLSVNVHCAIRDNRSRKAVNALIKKYIHLRPHIQDKIDAFIEDNYKGFFVIGVHYRGTDKKAEAPRIPYEKMLGVVNAQVVNLKGNPFKIFVATDEVAFLDYIKSLYPDNVCCLESASRSTDGKAVHTNSLRDPYKIGEEALLDCVLLSKTNILIRISSNLSLASTFFNPDLPVIYVKEFKIQGNPIEF